MNNCIACKKETKNPKFCSRTCSAKTTNKTHPRRKPEGSCKRCLTAIITSRVYCDKCWQYVKSNDLIIYPNKLSDDESYKKKLCLYRIHNKIRANSRVVYYKQFPELKCEKCGYNRYIEVCHIKPVRDFKKDIPDKKFQSNYSEVNNILNLIGLCRNCHWEFDHGDWTIDTIERFKNKLRCLDSHQDCTS